MKKRVLSSFPALSGIAMMFTGCGSRNAGNTDAEDTEAAAVTEETTTDSTEINTDSGDAWIMSGESVGPLLMLRR